MIWLFLTIPLFNDQGKAGSEAGDRALKEQLANMKRENNELNTRIKQLDAEIKRGAKQATTMGNEDVCVLERILVKIS